MGGLYLWLRPLFGVLYLVSGSAEVAVAFYLRSRGTVLTRESVVVRGVRRRSIPWPEVQAVIAARQGEWHIRLILGSGESVVLRAPRSAVGLGVRRYERDFHRIGQWWLVHRGESWRPVQPEAPPLTVQR
jgi:hypothetical protein